MIIFDGGLLLRQGQTKQINQSIVRLLGKISLEQCSGRGMQEGSGVGGGLYWGSE
jgi:hypothetical protein